MLYHYHYLIGEIDETPFVRFDVLIQVWASEWRIVDATVEAVDGRPPTYDELASWRASFFLGLHMECSRELAANIARTFREAPKMGLLERIKAAFTGG